MCRMCEGPGRFTGPRVNEVLERIEEYGWCVQGVLGTDFRPPWAYTVGLTAEGLPELVITGLPPHLAAGALNAAAAEALCTGPPVPGEPWWLPRSPRLEIVQLSAPAAHLSVAVSCYGTEIEARQLVYPDDAGRFPWSPRYNSGLGGQPVLGVRHDS
ncbi:DUF4262 domain-containing protein [Amycolatopsis jejuensis]|uniref:DUF4262 domain-containing protein n=1 Tax=Amycolatopsis jejuensis TaxID=330084 RepID=UPI0005240507|nr:DUF4262 domain-containing protein [Amycolatopsis jejuensis]